MPSFGGLGPRARINGRQRPCPCHVRTQRRGVERQGKKGRLEGIFSLVRVVQHAQTDVKDHLRVPPEKPFKSRLIATGGQAVEKLGIAGVPCFRGHAANPAKDRYSFALGHDERSLDSIRC